MRATIGVVASFAAHGVAAGSSATALLDRVLERSNDLPLLLQSLACVVLLHLEVACHFAPCGDIHFDSNSLEGGRDARFTTDTGRWRHHQTG